MRRRVVLWLLVGVLGITAGLAGGCTKPLPTLQVGAEQVGKDLVIKIETTNFTVGRSGHVHLRINGGPEVMLMGNSYTLSNAAPGTYSIFVQLSDPNHRNLDVDKTIEVLVQQ